VRRNEPTKAAREAEILERSFPAYTTSAGWLGYDDEALPRGVAQGWTHFKLKVGRSLDDDVRRVRGCARRSARSGR
jgi:L-fuconate dehydratase